MTEDRGPPAQATAELTVRRATATDVEAVVDLMEAVVDEGRWLGAEPPLDRSQHLERLATAVAEPEGPAILVAVDAGGAVVGYLNVERRPYGVANLAMFVAAGWRRRGVGSALVEAAVAAARASGAHKVALQVWPNNRPALSLYAKFGFVEEGRLRRHYRRRDGALWDAVVMGLVLDEVSPGGPPGEQSSSAGRSG